MRPYFGLRARIILTLTFLVFSCIALLAGSSYAMSRDVLLDMQKANLDLTTQMKQSQTLELLNQILSEVVHTAASTPIQQILRFPGDSQVRKQQSFLLSQSLDTNLVLDATIYDETGTIVERLALSSEFNNTEDLFIIPTAETNNTALHFLNTTGVFAQGPFTAPDDNTLFLLSFTVPVPSVTRSQYYEVGDVTTSGEQEVLGYLTAICSCRQIQSFFGESYTSSEISPAILAKLADHPSIVYLLPAIGAESMVTGHPVMIPQNMWKSLADNTMPKAEFTKTRSALLSLVNLNFVNLSFVLLVSQTHAGVFGEIFNLAVTLAITCCCVGAAAFLFICFLTISGARPMMRLKKVATARVYAESLQNVYETTDSSSSGKSLASHPTSDLKEGSKKCPVCGGTLQDEHVRDVAAPASNSRLSIFSFRTSRSGMMRWRPRAQEVPPTLCDNCLDAVESQVPTSKEGDQCHQISVPRKVSLKRRHLRDEFDQMTVRLNAMSDALLLQYKKLDERVKARKHEIEIACHAADEANAAKSHFLARVTHELRTPLNGILGTATLCVGEESLPKIQSSLKTVFKCGELLLHLLTDLLSFSQSEVENFELDEHEFTISDVTSQLAAIFREQSASAKISLDIKLADDCSDLSVYGDVNRILQVVFNLLSNSLKFTPQGGKISFTASQEAYSDPGKRLIVFVVQDTGPGIAPHLQARVFEAFVQGDINKQTRRAGVGLGLSICRQLAERMNGSIELKSELGQGSKFTFRVPLQYVQKRHSVENVKGENEESWPEYELKDPHTIGRKLSDEACTTGSTLNVKPSAPVRMGSKTFTDGALVWGMQTRPELRRGMSIESSGLPDLHVLIAEDNKVNQEVMIRMLNLEGLKDITIANDGLEAVAKVKQALSEGAPFDIVFMDVQMPNLDGRKATQILRTELSISVPIVAVSAFANDDNVQECLEVGMDVFLAKPLRRPALHKLLQSITSI